MTHQRLQMPQHQAWQKHWDSHWKSSLRGQVLAPSSKTLPSITQVPGKQGRNYVRETQSWDWRRLGYQEECDGRCRCLGILGRARHRGAVEGVGNKRRMSWHCRRRSKSLCGPGNSQGKEEGDGRSHRVRFLLQLILKNHKNNWILSCFLRANMIRRYFVFFMCV